jgi:AcrR family transcriptional regulator
MGKGDNTRVEILDSAFELARQEGLEAMTIGSLARVVEMSKSGLFAHFESKTNLQIAVLEHAQDIFVERVMKPAFAAQRGEPRVQALFDTWLDWAQSKHVNGGCIFLGAAAELDDAEGPVRDFLVGTQDRWLESLGKCIQMGKDAGHFRSDLDVELAAYQFYGNMMAFHFYTRLMRDAAAEDRARATFETLLETWRHSRGDH